MVNGAADFNKYENARFRYAELQEELREFLSQFTSTGEDEAQTITMRQIATLEGLRITRDIAFAEYSLAEAKLIKNVLDRLQEK